MRVVDYILIDGNNLAFRSFYGVKDLSNGQNIPVNAIYGFFNSLFTLQQQFPSKKTIVCFDCSRSEKRVQLLPDYKENRLPTPDTFKTQLNYIKQMIPLLGHFCWEKQGVEADDLIGSWCHWTSMQKRTCLVVSADKDLMQCVNDYVNQVIPTAQGWNLIDRSGVFEKMGIYPEQLIDFLSLIGDKVDNYPGIAGVGPKTAAKWLNTYGSIGKIYENIQVLMPKRFQTILLNNVTLLKKNQQLAALEISNDYVEAIMTDLEAAQPQYEAFAKMLEQLHLPRLFQKFKSYFHTPSQQIELF